MRADIKVKEQSEENLIKGRLIFEPPRYMTAADAATQLLTILERRKRDNRDPGTNLLILRPKKRLAHRIRREYNVCRSGTCRLAGTTAHCGSSTERIG